MRKYLECEKCDRTFKNRRALAGHMRLAHNVLMGEKQEIKDQLTRLEELKAQDGEALEELVDVVKKAVNGIEELTTLLRQEVKERGDLAEKVKGLETTLDETMAGLVEEEKEPEPANPGEKKLDDQDKGKKNPPEKKKKGWWFTEWLFGKDTKEESEESDDDSIFL
ncbi:hypothetical protein ES705_33743 [subsurface metagenome]